MIRAVATSLFVVLIGTGPAVAAARDDQWIYRDTPAAGQPTAVFLSWAFASVVFRATCDHKTRELVLEYMGDGAVPLSRRHELSVGREGERRGLSMRTRMTTAWRKSGTLEGRLLVTPAVKSAIGAAGPLQIAAPNEMGDPWYVGEAEPLKRIIQSCG